MRKAALLLALSAGAAFGQTAAETAAQVLAENCAACHGKAAMSGLDLRSRASMLKGGTRGAAIVPGSAEQSRLYRFLTGAEKPQMPPAGALAPAKIAAIKQWIDSGAPELALDRTPHKTYWAFTPPVRKEYGGNAIDQLWTTGSPADRRTLIRRAYLDLLGLPPTPAAVEAFVKDDAPDAWPKLVSELLNSPQYGERWARHWLDLFRFADSAGYEFDRDRPNAWRYRDYLIQAFNDDKPYDRLIRENLAGDEIWPGNHQAMIATGFLRHGPEANIATEQSRLDELDDLVATTGGAFLGLTIGCARCHDHKFDPIPQADYHKLQAVFWNTAYNDFPLADSAEIARHREAMQAFEARVKAVRAEKLAVEKPFRDRLMEAKRAALPDYMKAALQTPEAQRTEGQKLTANQVSKTLQVKDEEILSVLPAAEKAQVEALAKRLLDLEAERPKPLPAALAIRNNPKLKSPREPGVLSALGTEVKIPAVNSRAALADWIASPANPLTARVLVNRVFLHHFGETFVDTPSNFGKSGAGVKNQELLDWLATEFMAQGWSLKRLHWLIMTSKAYQAKLRPRRLEGEALRDSMLAASGALDLTMGGPGVYPFIDPRLWQASSGRSWPGKPDDDPSTWRRSVYIFTKRTIPVPMLEVFDKPDTQQGSCARRNRSTTSTQSLILMNSPFVDFQAAKFAARLKQEAGANPADQLERAFAVALQRKPTAAERDLALSFIERGGEAGLRDFCQTLFNLNEFAYIP